MLATNRVKARALNKIRHIFALLFRSASLSLVCAKIRIYQKYESKCMLLAETDMLEKSVCPHTRKQKERVRQDGSAGSGAWRYQYIYECNLKHNISISKPYRY